MHGAVFEGRDNEKQNYNNKKRQSILMLASIGEMTSNNIYKLL